MLNGNDLQISYENSVARLVFGVLGTDVKTQARDVLLVKFAFEVVNRNLRSLPVGREKIWKRVHAALLKSGEIVPVLDGKGDVFSSPPALGVKHDFGPGQVERRIKVKTGP